MLARYLPNDSSQCLGVSADWESSRFETTGACRQPVHPQSINLDFLSNSTKDSSWTTLGNLSSHQVTLSYAVGRIGAMYAVCAVLFITAYTFFPSIFLLLFL